MSAASLRGDRGAALVAAFGDDARRAGGIARHDRLDVELADDVAALPERVDVALDGLDVGEFGAARRHQLMMDRQEPFADDEQAGLRQQMMDIGDAAGDRVLDRDHAEVGFARGDRGQRVLEGRAGQRLGVGIGLGDGDMGIRARLALECDFHGFGRCFGHGAPCISRSGFSPVCGGWFRGRPGYRRRAARCRRWRYRSACRPPAPATVRASPAAPAARAAAPRNAPAPRGDRHRGRCDGSAARRPRAPWRG